jgi:alpha-glucosidase
MWCRVPGEKGDGILYLNVWNSNEPNNFIYYEDDGNTYQYEDGKYYVREINFNPQKKEISMDDAKGSYSSKFHEVHLILHGFPQNSSFIVNGKSVKTNSCKEPFISFENVNEKIAVKW